MKKLLILLSLTAILLAGCGGKDAEETNGTDTTETTSASVPPLSIPSGKQEAVVPEEGDIVIPINP